MNRNFCRLDAGVEITDKAAMASIQSIGDAQESGEMFNTALVRRLQARKIFLVGFRQGASMIASGHGHEFHRLVVPTLPASHPNQLRRGFVMIEAAWADGPSNIVQASGAF